MDEKDIPQRFRSCIEHYKEYIAEMASGDILFASDYAEDLCESEVEKTFLMAWLLHLQMTERFGSGHGGSAKYHIYAPDSGDDPAEVPSFSDPVRQYDIVKAQHKVPPYRADFVLRRAVFDGQDLLTSPLVAVEIDGHDFHEKTKEQAARDKERDRVLQTAGYLVLRFTGSEVYRDVQRCVEQVDECIEEHLARLCIEARERRQQGGSHE